jgi:predicted RecB family nuclease
VHRDGSELVVSPTDLAKFLACRHLTTLDLAVADGRRGKPWVRPDELLQLLFAKGTEHETRVLEAMGADSEVVVIDGPLPEAVAATQAAIARGAERIYQAAFLHDGRRGHADFLIRTDRPSRLGNWSYDVADTKLARRLKVPALLQMAAYGEHLRRIQGVPPHTLTVIAGDGTEHSVAFADVEAYARRVTARFDEFVRDPPPTIAEPVPHCDQCRWRMECTRSWRDVDHLSFVAFLPRTHRHKLEQAGITTLAELAARQAADLPRAMGRPARERLVGQARLQLAERDAHEPSYELLDPVEGKGLLRLPEPDPADVYLDFEADRYVEPDGLEYLAGLGDRQDQFTPIWAHTFDAERALTETLIDYILDRWRHNPGMHVYHYAPYEKAALQRLTARHGVREAELDVLLRAEVLVDLYAVVRQGLRISKESYSIKKLEAFYWGHVRGEGDGDESGQVAEAISSVLAYERWLVEHDEEILKDIAAYNFDDVRSTHDLHDWLEARRIELEVQHGRTLPRTGPPERPADPSDAELAEAALAQQCLVAGESLLAGLVGWHRREARPAWWDVFRLEDLDDEELVADGTAIGGLEPPTWRYDIERSHVHRYNFPPQETKLAKGDTALGVDDHKRIGLVVDIDATGGWVDIRIGQKREPPAVRGIGRDAPMPDGQLRSSIADTAERILRGEDCLGARLIRRVTPAGLPVKGDESPVEAMLRLGTSLAGEVLAVQGPPGTGKSSNGAELIRALLDRNLRVGVTAQSHQVIGGLLKKVERPALQRCDKDDQWCGSDCVERAANSADVVGALVTGRHRLVGGTAWLWARPEMAGTVDVLLIDEAGQFALASAVAASRAARSLVLLGDPQQLTQPSQAIHPFGAEVSALGHLLDGHHTVPADRGVFLDQTWRMQPDITKFVSITSYDDRLESHAGTERQVIVGAGRWTGSGLRMVAVPHTANASASAEEARVVAGLVEELLELEWIHRDGKRRSVGPRDILIVAPYNAHVARLRESVRPGIEIGTVDKFQGREAAVVIYSMASSSAVDAPRGVEFLYDVHRLNVAVSRARAMTIVVCSPTLLDAEVSTPHQLRLVNALCRYAELAQTVSQEPSE